MSASARNVALSCIAALLPITAFADPVANCYQQAAQGNSGASFEVEVAGNPVTPPGASISQVMQAVAQYVSDTSTTLTYNAAGASALNDVIECFVDSSVATVSIMWVHKHYPAISSRSASWRIVEGSSYRDFTLSGVMTCGQNRWATFNDAGDSCGAFSRIVAYGAHDGLLQSMQNQAGDCLSTSCTAMCLGECPAVPGPPECSCSDSSGSCVTVLHDGDVVIVDDSDSVWTHGR